MESFSEECQDLFAFKIAKEKTDGVFIDIGSGPAKHHNNSYALEQQRQFLTQRGYTLIAGKVLSAPGRPFEDWWVYGPGLYL